MSKFIKRGLLLVALSYSALATQSVSAQTTVAGQNSNAGVDNRRGIVVLPKERTLILNNMRQYLIGIQKFTEALADDNMDAAVVALRSMGSINLYDIRLKFANDASIEFHEKAFAVYKDFDRIAAEGGLKKDGKLMLKQVSYTMKKCTNCHETFRLQDTAH